jgi:hypothetical protein
LAFARQLSFRDNPVSLSDIAPPTRDPEFPSESSINDWGHRVSDARARITTEIRGFDDACDDANFARISDVRRIALRQGTGIDTHRPEHRLSSSSAKACGRNGMFSMLERQAEAATRIGLLARPRWKR